MPRIRLATVFVEVQAMQGGRHVVLVVWLGLVSSAAGQLNDPLPEIPVSPHRVRLSEFARGIPVEQEFVTPVFTQNVGPTDLAVVPGADPRIVVTSYGGQAWLVDHPGQPLPPPFLDLASPLSPTYNPRFEIGGAHGLTTIAFHPQFAQAGSAGRGRFYTLEPESSGSGVPDFTQSVRNGDHHQDVLYEYTLADAPTVMVCDVVCAGTKRELMRVTQPGWHHNLGDLLFAESGELYIASGDGSVAGITEPIMSDNSQQLDNVFGKVLRIDPLGSDSDNGAYGIPAGNPFRDRVGSFVDEIFAWGLRNPFRLEWDQLTGALYASETGENRVESVERIVAGGNYGWNRMEGSFVYDRFTRHIFADLDLDGDGQGDLAQQHHLELPVLQYDRSEGRAIVGAVPYRGAYVPWLEGNIVIGDFDGTLFHGDPNTGEILRIELDEVTAAPLRSIHSVNRGPDGEIYLLGTFRLDNGELDGRILRVHASPATDGDFHFDGQRDVTDIDWLSESIRQGVTEPLFDVSGDGQVNQDDRRVWVEQLRRTYFGDANLDGQFNSTDLVLVLAAGEYEDGRAGNSTWATGDWDGDGDFTTRDLVLALAHGGYEAGPRPVTSVPEPAGCSGLALALALLPLRAGRVQRLASR
jgi:hypothetical protein